MAGHRGKQGILRSIVGICVLLAAPGLFAADVRLQWDASTDGDLSGYKVYVGTASRVYSQSFTIPCSTTHTVSGLADGTYYFTITALNGSGDESEFSNEVSTTVNSSVGMPCDMNGDRAVNALDIQALINVILGASSCSGNPDINRDGRADALDLQTIGNIILGLWSCS